MENKRKKSNLIIIFLAIIALVIIIGICYIIEKTQKQAESKPQAQAESEVISDKPQPSNDVDEEDEENENNTNSDFAFRFLVLDNPNENYIYSPLSIKYALSMLNEGAEGETKAQIDNIIKDESLTKYENIDSVLSLANALYIKDTYSKYIKDSYKNTLKDKFDAEINFDSFEKAGNINKWIKEKTFGQISNLLGDDQVQSAKSILVNALAIDMEWESGFESENTRSGDFYLSDGSKMETAMMHKKTSNDDIMYYVDDELTAFSMNLKQYDDTQLEFIGIKPENGLEEYTKDFNEEKLNEVVNKLEPASESKAGIILSLPRFKYDYKMDLNSDLQKLGITDAFTSGADFSNMTDSPDGFTVDEVLHKADIEASEEGVKAAAVTVVVLKSGATAASRVNPVQVSFDKPFLFVIRDKKTSEIWFVGTVYKPLSWEDIKADY